MVTVINIIVIEAFPSYSRLQFPKYYKCFHWREIYLNSHLLTKKRGKIQSPLAIND